MNNQFKKIICPIDFSETSELALVQAVTMAEQSGAELILMTVLQPMPPTMFGDGMLYSEFPPLREEAPKVLQEHLAKLRDKHCAKILERTSLQVEVGVPFAEIVRHAREVEADLIVMGSHGRTGIEHLMIGSVAERVVRKAPCSVLVVRDAKHRFVTP